MIQSSILQAVRCADILKNTHTYDLSAHVGVSYGRICFATLGGYRDEWVYLITGDCLWQLSHCLADSQAGQVVLSKTCQNFLTTIPTEMIDTIPLDSGNYLLVSVGPMGAGQVPDDPMPPQLPTHHAPTTLDNFIRRFVPVVVRQSVTAGTFDTISEIRETTTLFLRLDDYTVRSATDASSLQTPLVGLQELLAQYGGFLRQFLVDDKGCVFIGMWGVPGASYPTNSSRAVKCAISFMTYIESLGQKCSIGVATGRVFCGIIGAPVRRDYVVLGDAVNLAARLMGKAQGRILVDHQTFSRLRKAVADLLEVGDMIIVKGHESPLQPYCYTSIEKNPLAMSSSNDARSSMGDMKHIAINSEIASRLDDELNVLLFASCGDANNKTCHHDGGSEPGGVGNYHVRYILVEGAAGMGKSTVADYFQYRALDRGLCCVRIRVSPVDESIEYSVTRKLFMEMIDSKSFATESQQREVLRNIVKEVYPNESAEFIAKEHFPVLKLALGLQWQEDVDSNEGCKTNRGIIKKRSFRFFGNTTIQNVLLHMLSRNPTALIVDDANFSDELSMKELKLMLNCKGGVLGLLTFHLKPEDVVGMPTPSLPTQDMIAEDVASLVSPGRLRNSPRMRQYFQCDDEDWTVSPRTLTGSPRRSTSPFVVPLNQHDDGERERASNQELYTEFASKSHILNVGGHTPLRRRSILSKYGLTVNKCGVLVSFASLSNTLYLRLPPLTVDEVRDLLGACFFQERDDVADDLVELVYEVTGGNPFWVRSIAKYIRATGTEQFTSSCLDYSESDHFGHVEGNADVFNAQMRCLAQHFVCHLDKFSVEVRTIAKYASIIGNEFREDILAEILPDEFNGCDQLPSHLDILAGEGVVARISDRPRVYVFQNELIRQTLYDLFLPSEATVIHKRIAQAMEECCKDTIRSYYACLSYHYAMAEGCRSSAFRFTVKTADQAISQGSFSKGLTYLDHAASFLEYESELIVLLKVAEMANFDMSPKSTLMTRFAHLASMGKKRPLNPPFTSEDIATCEVLINDYENALETMRLYGTSVLPGEPDNTEPSSSFEDCEDDQKEPHSRKPSVVRWRQSMVSLPSYTAQQLRTRDNCVPGCVMI